MKYLVITFTLLFFTAAHATTTQLSGHLASPADKTVMLQYYASPIDEIEAIHTQYECPLDKDNNFHFEFDIVQPVSLTVKNGDKYLFYNKFITPGDSIWLSFEQNSIRMDGQGASGMAAMFDLDQKFLEGASLSEMQNSRIVMEPVAFAKYWTARLDSELAFVDRHFAADTVTDVWRNVVRKELIYEAAVQMVQLPFRGRKAYRNLLSDDNYRKYLSAIPYDDTTALATGMYVHFLRELPYNMWACKSDTNYFDEATRKYNSANQYRLRDSIARVYLKGKTYDVALYQILHDQLRGLEYGKGSPSYDSIFRETAKDVISACSSFSDPAYADKIRTKLLNARITDRAAPDFAAYTLDGKNVKLSDFKGKVVYVDFWATSCGPCVAEIPHAKKLQEEYKDKDVVFLYVSLDQNKATLDHFLKERSFTGTHLVDSKGFLGDAAVKYNIASIPRHILVDKAGNLVSADAPRPTTHPQEIINAALAK